MVKDRFVWVVLGLFLVSVHVVSAAQRAPQTTVKEVIDNREVLNKTIENMRLNDLPKISPSDQTIFDGALKKINEKVIEEGKKKIREEEGEDTLKNKTEDVIRAKGEPTLSTEERSVYDQDLLNKTKPTVTTILMRGKKYPWGIDLYGIEERKKNTRGSREAEGKKGGVGGNQGNDLASSVRAYQNYKIFIKNREQESIKRESELNKQIQDIKSKSQGKKLKPADENQIKSLEKDIEQTKIWRTNDQQAHQDAINKLTAITKLTDDQIKMIPDLKEWEEMKAGKKPIPTVNQPTALMGTHRKGASTKTNQVSSGSSAPSSTPPNYPPPPLPASPKKPDRAPPPPPVKN